MCLGGGKVKSAEEFYQEMRVEPKPLPKLPTGGDRVERKQSSGLGNIKLPAAKRTGQTQRTLLNVYGGGNG